MNGLERDALFAACRAIYLQASGKCILPPLLRSVGDTPPVAAHLYRLATADGEIQFSAALGERPATRRAGVPADMPLHIDVRHIPHEGESIAFDARDRFELIRAFLLGVKLPIAVEIDRTTGAQRVTVQLAPRYSFDCGEIAGVGDDSGCDNICESVSAAIYARTASLFAGPQNGLAVWHMRAAQELFGDPRPAPETFWPCNATEADVNPFVATPARTRMPATMRYSVAASLIAAALLAALTGVGMWMPARQQNLAGGAVLAPEAPITLRLVFPEQQANIEAPAKVQTVTVEPSPQPASGAATAIEPAMQATTHAPALPLFMIAPLNAFAPPVLRNDAMRAPRTVAVHAPKPKSAPQRPRARLANKDSRPRFANPLPSAKKVAATIAGAVKGIEKIPMRIAALVKAQTQAR